MVKNRSIFSLLNELFFGMYINGHGRLIFFFELELSSLSFSECPPSKTSLKTSRTCSYFFPELTRQDFHTFTPSPK